MEKGEGRKEGGAWGGERKEGRGVRDKSPAWSSQDLGSTGGLRPGLMGGQTPLPRPFSLGPPPPGSTIPKVFLGFRLGGLPEH